MKVNIVNYELAFQNTGILSKYSYCLEREANKLGINAYVTALPDNNADITHHINYLAFKPTNTLNTLMITHIAGDSWKTEEFKVGFLKERCKTDLGITMSAVLVEELVKRGIPRNMLASVYHAHDSIPRRPRVIAILTNIYVAHIKREWMFEELFDSIDPSKFLFKIMGTGWKDIMERWGDKINCEYYNKFDIDKYKEILETSDYVLGVGAEDCANQAHLDAIQAGIRTIFPDTPIYQELGVDLPFTTQEDLNNIFKTIATNKVEHLTWQHYAAEHIRIWRAFYEDKHGK